MHSSALLLATARWQPQFTISYWPGSTLLITAKSTARETTSFGATVVDEAEAESSCSQASTLMIGAHILPQASGHS